MSGNEISNYCREIEAYLCRKNDGHLIRVVGPSFEVVSRWAADGVPLKIAFRGIDRYFERYYRNGARRRPVKIDFCEADVLDVFDEWQRAVGIVSAQRRVAAVEDQEPGAAEQPPAERDDDGLAAGSGASRRKGPSLPEHLERVVMKLTSARATGQIGQEFDELVDRIAGELDRARSESRGVRGAAREALIERLAALDAELVTAARSALPPEQMEALSREAADELSGFRTTMSADAFARAMTGATNRLVRERLNLPVVSFGP